MYMTTDKEIEDLIAKHGELVSTVSEDWIGLPIKECDGTYICCAEEHEVGCLTAGAWDGVCQYGDDCPACED
jgi:hypothetical protein